jgi:hypothetical protein
VPAEVGHDRSEAGWVGWKDVPPVCADADTAVQAAQRLSIATVLVIQIEFVDSDDPHGQILPGRVARSDSGTDSGTDVTPARAV